MKYKIGGGFRLQPYDESNDQYSNTGQTEMKVDKRKISDSTLYLHAPDNEIILNFPDIKIHDDDYIEYFVNLVRLGKNYKEAFVDDPKINKYLFIHKDERDKSKFMIEILGYSNDEQGWKKAKDDLLKGSDFFTMWYDKERSHSVVSVTVATDLYDKKGNLYKTSTSWELKEDLTLRFITLIIRRIEHV